MSGKYPWGNQAPATRLKGLNRQLEKAETAREKCVDEHKAKLATHDEGLRALRSDIRQVNTVIDKVAADERAEKLKNLLTSLLDSEDPEALEKAMESGSLQTKLKSATKEAVSEAGKAPTPSTKETKAKEKA